MSRDNTTRSLGDSGAVGIAVCMRVWAFGAWAFVVGNLWIVAGQCAAETHQLGYSFYRDGGGGIAVVRIDGATGRFVDEQVLFESKDCTRPEKLRYDTRGKQYLLTNETDKKSGPHLFVVPTAHGAPPRSVKLPDVPDEVRIRDGFAMLTCDGDWLVRVDLAAAQIIGKWDAAEILDPPGNGPQDIRFLADGQTVVVSFQKDSGSGKKKGSRIAAFRLPEMQVVADAQLPRSRPDLHISENDKEQGPGPEVIYLDEPGNRLFVTLDLYGAVAVAELESYLAGEDVTWTYLSTAIDGTWGDAFPDRMSAFEYSGKTLALVANSGAAGGVVMLDSQRPEIVWRCASPPGLEAPVFVACEGKAFSVCSGKNKVRARRDTEKTFLPQSGVYVFDLAVAGSTNEPCLERIDTETFLFRIGSVGTDEKPWLVVAGGVGGPDTLMILDPRTGLFVDQRPAIGSLMQFEQM